MKTPIRSCAGCGARKAKSEMIRIGVAGGTATVTEPGKVPGRGAYLCPSALCLKKAIKNGSFSRKLHLKVPDALYKELGLLIEERQKVTIG